jgi:hypothetical protein
VVQQKRQKPQVAQQPPTAQPQPPPHRQPQPPQRQPAQPRQPQPPHRQPHAICCNALPLFSLSNRWNVARLTSAISSSPSVTAWVGAKLSFCGTSAVGMADAEALPTSPKVKPAAPNAGTAALVTRFRFGACFTRGIVASSIPVQDESFFDSNPNNPTLRARFAQGYRIPLTHCLAFSFRSY